MACNCGRGRQSMDDASVEYLFDLIEKTPGMTRTGEVNLLDIQDPLVNLLVEIIREKAQYLNDAGTEYLIMRLRQKYVERVPDMGLSSNNFTDELKNKLEGLPDNKTLQDIINSINSANWEVVDTLPATGKPGTIYLVPLVSTQSDNRYAEYIFIQSTQQWELLGIFGINGSGLVSSIGLNTKTYKPDINGRLTLDPAVVQIVFNNKAYLVDAHGRIDLGDVGALGGITSITANGSTLTPDKNGSVDISSLLSAISEYLKLTGGTLTGDLRLKTGNKNYGSVLNWGDGDYVHISEPSDDNMEIKAKNINFVLGSGGTLQVGGVDILQWLKDNGVGGSDTEGTVTAITMNSKTYNPDASGIIALGNVCVKATINGSTKNASTAGTIALGAVCTKITLNGTTYSVSTAGTINLGTIESGGGSTTNNIYTGTTIPAASLGADGDFYYKMK